MNTNQDKYNFLIKTISFLIFIVTYFTWTIKTTSASILSVEFLKVFFVTSIMSLPLTIWFIVGIAEIITIFFMGKDYPNLDF